MLQGHPHHPELVRPVIAGAMVFVGVTSLAWPRCTAGMAGTFTRWLAGVSPEERARLNRVVDAREDAEGLSSAYGRYLGIAAIVLAAFEVVPAIPFVVPYACVCLAVSVVTLLAYLQFRRATEQRVAPLVRRSPLSVLPLPIIGSVLACVVVALAVAADPAERLGALVLALSTIVLGGIAWRIANAPALLLGQDPPYEYALDELVRAGRARIVANLACTPVFLLAVVAQDELVARYGARGSAAMWVASAAFVISFIGCYVPLRRRLTPA